MWAALLVLHGPGMVAVLDSKNQDATIFRQGPVRHYQAALERSRPDERIGVIGLDVTQFFEAHGLSERDAADLKRRKGVDANTPHRIRYRKVALGR